MAWPWLRKLRRQTMSRGGLWLLLAGLLASHHLLLSLVTQGAEEAVNALLVWGGACVVLDERPMGWRPRPGRIGAVAGTVLVLAVLWRSQQITSLDSVSSLLPLIAGLGVAGAGIALAMQGVLGNIVAGLTIIFTRPFRVGDYISIVKEEGVVQEITLFSTVLGHADLSRVVIPNRKIVGEILHNYGTLRQLNLTVGVAYDTDIGRALQVIDEVLKSNPKVVRDPEPVVRVTALADFSVNIAVRPWAQVIEAGVTSSEINRAILERFRASGIQIPFPQREVRMLTPAAR